MPKNKPNKGLLKRVRITGSGKVKFQRASGRHLRSHKAGSTMRKYRQPAYVTSADIRRLRAMLPGVKIKAKDAEHQPAVATPTGE